MLRCVVERVRIQDADSWRHFANEPQILSFFLPFFPVKDRHGVTKVGSAELYIQSFRGGPGKNFTYNRPPFITVEVLNRPPFITVEVLTVLIRYAGIPLSAGHRFWNVNLAEGLAVHPNVGTCWGDIFFWQIIFSRTARRLLYI